MWPGTESVDRLGFIVASCNPRPLLCLEFESGHRNNQRQFKQLINDSIGNANIGFKVNDVHLTGFFPAEMHLVDADLLEQSRARLGRIR